MTRKPEKPSDPTETDLLIRQTHTHTSPFTHIVNFSPLSTILVLLLLLLGFRASAPGVHLGHPRDHAARGSEAEHRRGQDQHPQYWEHPRPSSSASSAGILGTHEHQPGTDLGKGRLLLPATSPLSVRALCAHTDGGRGPRPSVSLCSSRDHEQGGTRTRSGRGEVGVLKTGSSVCAVARSLARGKRGE